MKPEPRHYFKIFGLVLVPFLAFLVFAGMFIYSNFQKMEASRRISTNTLIFGSISSLIHQIQLERGKTSLFFHSSFSLEDLEKQRAKSDERLKGFLESLGSLENASPTAAKGIKDQLESVRLDVLKKTDFASAYESYTRIITFLMDLEKMLAAAFSDTETTVFYNNILLIESAREYSGRLRANLARIILKNQPMGYEEILFVLKLYSAIDPLLDARSLNLSLEAQSALATMRVSTSWVEVNNIILSILQKSEKGDYGIGAATFFELITRVLDDLETIIKIEITKIGDTQGRIFAFSKLELEKSAFLMILIFFYLFVSGYSYIQSLYQQDIANEALRNLSKKNELILSAAGEGILGLNIEGKTTFINQAGAKMLGYSPGELIGKSCHSTWLHKDSLSCRHPDEKCSCMQSLTCEEGVKREDEVFFRKDGTQFQVQYTSTPVLENDQVVAVVVVFQDISERKKTEAKLKETLSSLKKAHEALKEANQQEGVVAFQIQQGLLLGQFPKGVSEVKFGSIIFPSMGSDGDFFDFFYLDKYTFDLLFGDVMGKGIPAAMVGAATKSNFQRAMSRLLLSGKKGQIPSPEELVSRVHSEMTNALTGIERFVSMHYGRFDVKHRVLDLVNCGHTPLLHWNSEKKAVELHELNQVPLGIDEREVYKQTRISFGSGDLFLFFSDGITDARNPSGEFYGISKLSRFMKEHPNDDPQQFLETLYKELTQFTSTKEFKDDLTALALRIS